MEDLTEIALSALEADETKAGDDGGGGATDDSEPADKDDGATDNQPENSNPDEGEKESSESDNDNKGEDDSKDASDSGDSDDTNGSDADKKSTDDGEVKEADDKNEEKPAAKKELSDDEFEEMAKKRGYAKAPTDEEKRQAEQKQKEAETEQQTVERLTKKPQEIPDDVWENTPKNNKMVYNSLPIITARGKNGTSVNVKLPTQLPDGFEFADEKARVEFQTAMAEQGRRSDNMLAALDNRDKQIQNAEAQINFARQTIAEVTALQKSGDLPTPKAKPNTPEFKEDPAAKILDGVVGLRDQKMAEGYRLSMADATVLFKSQHPELFQPKNTYNEKADKERAGVARKVATGKKTSGKGADNYNQTPVYRPGSNMSLMDVAEEAMRREGIE